MTGIWFTSTLPTQTKRAEDLTRQVREWERLHHVALQFKRDCNSNRDHITSWEFTVMAGYADRAGIDNRANAALLAIDAISNDCSVPVAYRLWRIAQRMAQEPILTDESPAAYKVRELAREYYKS